MRIERAVFVKSKVEKASKHRIYNDTLGGQSFEHLAEAILRENKTMPALEKILRLPLKAWLLGLAVFLLGFGSLISAGNARELTVAINHAPPYRIVEDTTSGTAYSGIYIDVVREAAKRANVDLVFVVVPFKRALSLMETGLADLMLGPNRTDERQKFMYYFGAALPSEAKAIYTGLGQTNVRSVDDLDHSSVGVLRVANHNWQLDAIKDIRLVEAADYPTLFRMLDLQRIDALIVPELLAIEHIKRGGPYRVRKAGFVLQGEPSFIALSRGSAYFTDGEFLKLEQQLVEMRQDGTFDEIYAHYAGSGT